MLLLWSRFQFPLHAPCSLDWFKVKYGFVKQRRILLVVHWFGLIECAFHMQIKTVQVSNISQAITDKDIKEFCSFSGDIQYVEMQRYTFFTYIGHSYSTFAILKISVLYFCRETENTQLAYVTFKESQGADTAVLLSVCSLLIQDC